MIGIWTAGLARRRGGRLAITAAGVAAAVALLACLGTFFAAARASMTERAATRVGVDWQVQVQSPAAPANVLNTVLSTPGVRRAVPVGYAHVDGFSATAGGGTQTTGAGVVLGLPPDYRSLFPGMVRTLAGTDTGVVVAQQTAANLHVAPGDSVHIARAGLPAVDVVVGGVVDLPQADQLFQTVGAPTGAQPTAPPDNVLLLDQGRWHQFFDPLSALRPDLVNTQIHANLNHRLPNDPAAAYTQVSAAAHNLEARNAGGALVADNLGTALGRARSDAAYAQILFLFLGIPAVVLAGLLTATVVAAGADRRRAEQALLRARGASPRQLLRLAAAEAVLVGACGGIAGLAVALVVARAAFGSTSLRGATTTGWALGAAATGMIIAGVAVLAPAWRELRNPTTTATRTAARTTKVPAWIRFGIDFVLLAGSVAVFVLVRRGGYQLVVAPEGTPTISVSYWTFAAPALLWMGTALLLWRASDFLLGRGSRLMTVALRPLAGALSPIIAHTLARRRRSLSLGIVLVALAVSFAASTATFNSTYRAQAEVDAQLTNGADVTVTEPPAATVSPQAAGALAAVPGVRAVEPIEHRFAYIGADLQDLYGVNPTTITAATAVRDSYFQGGTAAGLLSKLAAQPDSILVSAETVKDFQLQPGDTINLRLPDSRTHQLTTVPFHYAGVVTEFPTAPKDSFFVTNGAYVAEKTGTDAVGAFLVDTGGRNTAAVAARIQALLGTGATVSDITTTRGTVGSSLTAVDLAGLTRIELAFGLVLAAASAALVLLLGWSQRRRGFAIATALGARTRHLRAFVAADAAVLAGAGLAAGAVAGWVLSEMLVALLTGVFDPPPHTLAVPWMYLDAVGAAIVVAIAAVSASIARLAARTPLATLREL